MKEKQSILCKVYSREKKSLCPLDFLDICRMHSYFKNNATVFPFHSREVIATIT